MQRQASCLKVPKRQGEKTLIAAKLLRLVDKELEIGKDSEFLYLPLIRRPPATDLKTLKKTGVNFEVSTRLFDERNRKTRINAVLQSELSPHSLASLPRAADFVGEIAIIEIPAELKSCEKIIGNAVLRVNKNVRTVLAKASAVSGTYRLREFKVIAGEASTETVHKEAGCRFKVDVTKAYFSPRLSHEHQRITSLVREGETVVDLFSGVGPFAIMIAKAHANVKVYAVDVNPHAVEYLKTNIRLNRVIGRVYPFLGDARKITDEKLSGIADRVIMNLPERAIEFVDTACQALRSEGGIIHFYSFINSSSSVEDWKFIFKEAVEKSGRRVEEFVCSRTVRETAPHEWQSVLDARIT